MPENVPFDAAKSLADVARELTEHPDLATAGQRLVGVAAKLIGCAGAAWITGPSSARPTVAAVNDAGLLGLEYSIMASAGSSPAQQAWAERVAVRADDLGTETRWPAYCAGQVERTAVRSVLALPLRLTETDLGVLALFALKPHYFDDALVDLAAVFAEHVTIALALVGARDHVGNLETALETNREIGEAIGILMERHGLTQQAAFDTLRTRSQHANVKLRDIARDVSTGGDIAPSDAG